MSSSLSLAVIAISLLSSVQGAVIPASATSSPTTSCPPLSDQHIHLYQGSAIKQSLINPKEELSYLHRYEALIPVGSTGQQSSVTIGTGSFDFWLPSQQDANSSHIGLELSATKKFGNGSVPCSDSYGNTGGANAKGGIAGHLVTVPFNLGGTQTEGQICDVKNGSFEGAPDGLLGLGGCAGSSNYIATKEKSSCPQDMLGWSSFGIQIDQGQNVNGTGVLSVNGVKEGLYEGDFTYEPVSLEKGSFIYWQFEMESISVGGKTLKTNKTNGVIDSGAPTMAFSDPINSFIKERIRADKKSGDIKCDNHGPDIVINSASGNSYAIPWNVYTVTLPSNSSSCVFIGTSSGPPSTADNNLGVQFIQSYYSHFEIKNEKTGGPMMAFAKSVANPLM